MGNWMNQDGLYLQYGTERATVNTAGEYTTTGGLREVEVKINLPALTQSETVVSDTTFIPAGVQIQEVEVITTNVAATGAAIDLGLIRTDRSTEIDYDGLLAAYATGTMDAIGERTIFTKSSTVPASATGTGALIGTVTANIGYLTCSRTTATAFTTGDIIVKIRYYRP
jgi:hypothetical protein